MCLLHHAPKGCLLIKSHVSNPMLYGVMKLSESEMQPAMRPRYSRLVGCLEGDDEDSASSEQPCLDTTSSVSL